MAKIIAYVFIFLSVMFIGGLACNAINGAGKVIKKEFNPETLLKKYEYFKDLSAAIDKKRVDIDMYQAEIASYGERSELDKDDKFNLDQRKSELIGIISMHNTLCSQYNSAMSKFNYRFTNAGDLPATNLEVLPREIKPYISSLK